MESLISYNRRGVFSFTLQRSFFYKLNALDDHRVLPSTGFQVRFKTTFPDIRKYPVQYPLNDFNLNHRSTITLLIRYNAIKLD